MGLLLMRICFSTNMLHALRTMHNTPSCMLTSDVWSPLCCPDGWHHDRCNYSFFHGKRGKAGGGVMVSMRLLV